MKLTLNLNRVDDYQMFLRIKSLPRYTFTGREAEFPDEYAVLLGVHAKTARNGQYAAPSWMFDYQRDITALAIRKRKFAAFMDCGLGKTGILLEYARHARKVLGKGRRVLIVSPLMVIRQTLAEAGRFFGKALPIEQVPAAQLQGWLKGERLTGTEFGGLVGAIGITNYEAIRDDLEPSALGALVLDESSMLKSHYGKWGTKLIDLGRGLDWKLCLTGTPAPNDRIEYANHAVFLDAFPTVNSFLARFFVNRGQTNERWELKPHALQPFYRALSHWCIFLTSPATYGWKDNAKPLPPIHVQIHDVDMTEKQNELTRGATGRLFADAVGGITGRIALAQIAKGNHKGKSIETLKPAYIKQLVDQWPDESTIIWCLYNPEQETLERVFPEAASLKGETPYEERVQAIEGFKAGRIKTVISKSKVLGWGLNLQICTRMVFSSLQDSYESYYQCIKRANRYGASRPLNVHVPLTEIEQSMAENVFRKLHRVQADTEQQELIFKQLRVEYTV